MKIPNWKIWGKMLNARLLGACALALNIDPASIKYENWIPGKATPMRESFPSDEVYEQFNDLSQLLEDWRFNFQHFPTSTQKGTVQLDEFAAWCVDIGWDIPQELKAMAKAKTQAAPAETKVALQIETPPANVESDNDKKLAALFDPVPVEALAKMFPTDKEETTAQWRIWTEKAKANGLIGARVNRKFNPYKAGNWFVNNGAKGWDTARLYRTLANNLPARSRDDAHLLTDGID